MGKSARSYAPVAARSDGQSVALPEWLFDGDDAPATTVAHDHVLSVRSRPAPQTAADLADRTTPKVDRLAPALRRLHAPRRVWARRAVVAGALVGSCAVLVSGIVLTSTGTTSPSATTAAAPAAALPTADLREELWGGGLITFGQGTLPLADPISSAVSVGSADPGYHNPQVAPSAPSPAAPAAPPAPSASPTQPPTEPTVSPTPTDPPTSEPPSSDPPTSDPPPTSDDPGDGGLIDLPTGFPFP